MAPYRQGLGAGLGVMLVALGLAAILPLWLDEVLQLIETHTGSAAEMLARLPRNPGAAPLGYLIQRASLDVTGYSVRRARLPSAIFGGGAVLLVALLAAGLGLRRPWVAAAMLAAFPLTLRYSTESRVYIEAL